MRFLILGPLEVRGENGAVMLAGIKLRALLVVLLLHANEAVSTERLAHALWGDDAGKGASKTVHVHVGRLRKALGDPQLITTTPAGYCLRVRPDELDAARFKRLVEDGRRALARGQCEHASKVLREALALWRGPALAELACEPFASTEIARFEEQRLAALEARVEADIVAGRHDELAGELRHLVAMHPTRERLTAQLMLTLYRCGRQTDALEVYRNARRVLVTEVGIEPGPRLRELQNAILRHDVVLDRHGGVLGLEPGAALKSPQRAIFAQAPSLDLQRFAGTESATSARDSERFAALPSVVTAGAQDLFVGRETDLDALAAVYAQVAGGRRRLVLLGGEPGIGKTRLATQFALRAHEDGAIVLYGRCDEEALLAQQPFVEALRHYVRACPPSQLTGRSLHVSGELRRIVPELADRIPGLPEPLAGDPDGARSRLFEAVTALLCEAAQSTPVVLVLDDLHWADIATLLLLKYLVRYPRQARLMVLGTYRQTELDVDHPLRATIADLGRERLLQRRALAALDAAAVSQLVGIHAGDEASPELRQIVYERTEGNAFFIVEMLRHLTESRVIAAANAEPEPGIGGLPVPVGVKDVIGQRVTRLGHSTSRLLATASVLGRTFELDVLQRLSRLDEDTLVDGLDSALYAHVIEEVADAAGRYTFSHALIRDTLYGGLTATRRALLHRRAGAALEEAHDAELEPHLAQLAHHFAQAGSSVDLDKAISYGTRAGRYAISLAAYEQAAAHFRRTIELIDTTDAARQRQRCDLVIAQGEAERQAGEHAYRQTLLDGARLAQELGDPDRLARAALANNRGVFSSALGVDRDRVSVLHAALDAYDSSDSSTRAALLSLLALELWMDDDWRLREKLSDNALAMARRVGDPHTLALVLTQRSIAKWAPQTLPELRADLNEAAQLADRLKDPLLAGHAAYAGALAAIDVGDLEQADRLLAALSAVAQQLGQPLMRWYAAAARATRCLISGPAEEAERLAFAALELGRSAQQPDSMRWLVSQLYVARFLQGSLDRGDPHLPDLFETAARLFEAPGVRLPNQPEITPSRSLPLVTGALTSTILCEVGRLDDARRHFELLMSQLDELPHDYKALAIPAFASVACARLGDRRSAKRLHAVLKPHSHRLVGVGSYWFGATTHYLGLLAATLDRPDEADAHFAAAEWTYTSLDAKPWLARLYSDRAETLRTRRLRCSR